MPEPPQKMFLSENLIFRGLRLRVIFYTLPLWKKEWQYTASSRDELENMPPEAICTQRPERAGGFPIHPSSRQCIIILSLSKKINMPKMMPFKRAAVVELRRNVRRFNILAAFFSTLPSLSLKLHSAQ